MRIAVDAMGGDYAPGVVVEGVANALYEYPEIEIILVGHSGKIAYYLEKYGIASHPRLSVVHAPTVVEMSESSATSIRGKKDSSITVGAKLLKSKEADAFVTPGHTGATLAATKVIVRTLPGVNRPALAASMPAYSGRFLLTDAGANVEVTPMNLAEFAVMGSVYCEFLYGLENPAVGLLSVGGEDSKGNDLTKEAFKLLELAPINFVGNVEGNTVFEGACKVLVADGFTGNVFLKTSEGLANSVKYWLNVIYRKNPVRMIMGLFNKRAFKELKENGSSEAQGGALLLGLNGVCIVGHGSSTPRAVLNAIRLAGECIKFGVNDRIVEKIDRLHKIIDEYEAKKNIAEQDEK
ncbi:MAG: phosphate acyltransferase PlsX [Lentisphaeria bacterium]|nr:phosphate acyltransferase PlsX [Lentisphaeria bacterium]